MCISVTYKMRILLIFLLIVPVVALTKGQGIYIGVGGRIDVTGASKIEISNGNFQNNGTYLSSGTENVVMTGTLPARISGFGATNMYTLSVMNTGGVISVIKQMNVFDLNVYTALTIDTASAMIVSNYLRNKTNLNTAIWVKAGAATPNGTLVFHNSSDSAVTATVEMYSKAFKNGSTYYWQFFGIPVESVTSSPILDGSYVRKYNEAGSGTGTGSANLWIQQTGTSVLNAFSGYEITQNEAKTIVFSGKLVNRNLGPMQLSYSGSSQYPGQHIIGNPYTSAIDIRKILFGSSDPNVIENSIYLYNTGSVSDWQGSSSSTNSPGQYISVPVYQSGVGGLPSQIVSMQAFLVRARKSSSEASIALTYSEAGTTGRNAEIQKIAGPDANNDEEKVYTVVEVTGKRYSDKTWIFTQPNCTKEYDNGWDGFKMSGSALIPRIWCIEKAGHLQVNSLNNIDSTTLGFIKGEDSVYVVKFTHRNTLLAYPYLYMVDLKTGAVVDVSADGATYTFVSSATGTDFARFRLFKSQPLATKVDDALMKGKADAFSYNAKVYIENRTGSALNCRLTDVDGRIVMNERWAISGLQQIQVQLHPGEYVISLSNEQGSVHRKIIIH